MKIYEELQARGLVAQVTNEEAIREAVNNGKAVFYIGFDPTADSLHVGHFMALCLMKRLQEAGNKPIVLLGDGTGMVGDPSGRTDMRPMMTKEVIAHNCECFRKQIERFIDLSEDKAIVVHNADWLMELKYVELLREVGAHFSVNEMLRAECYKNRMERGLSFFEFNYMIMQAYDFMYLHDHYGCNLQFGGNDQWSNMLAGRNLLHSKGVNDCHAMTITLLLNSEGNKMGKTANGAVWLDENKTTPFQFFQYWRNIADADVMKCLKMLTFLSIEQLNEVENWAPERINEKKELLAYELTKLVHGEEKAGKAREASHSLFGGNKENAHIPSVSIEANTLTDGKIGIIELMLACKLCKSKSEARTLIQQGGVIVNDNKVSGFDLSITDDQLKEGVMIRKGKKTFIKAVIG